MSSEWTIWELREAFRDLPDANGTGPDFFKLQRPLKLADLTISDHPSDEVVTAQDFITLIKVTRARGDTRWEEWAVRVVDE